VSRNYLDVGYVDNVVS